MSREMTAAMNSALQQGVVRPVLIGKLDFESDPITAWTGPNTFAPTGTGDPHLDGELFVPTESFIQMSDINEAQDAGSPVTLTLTGHDLDEAALRQIVRDKRQWRGRGAWLWLGLLQNDESAVVDDPIRIKTGYMTKFEVVRQGSEHTITLTIDNDLGNARSGAWRIQDHTRVYPTDTFSTFLVKLANKPQGLEFYDIQPNKAWTWDERIRMYEDYLDRFR